MKPMSNSLKLNGIEMTYLLNSIKSANSKLNTSTASVSKVQQCQGIMIDAYVDRIKKISRLLDQYKKLVEKDVTDVAKANNVLLSMDKNIGKNLF